MALDTQTISLVSKQLGDRIQSDLTFLKNVTESLEGLHDSASARFKEFSQSQAASPKVAEMMIDKTLSMVDKLQKLRIAMHENLTQNYALKQNTTVALEAMYSDSKTLVKALETELPCRPEILNGIKTATDRKSVLEYILTDVTKEFAKIDALYKRIKSLAGWIYRNQEQLQAFESSLRLELNMRTELVAHMGENTGDGAPVLEDLDITEL